MAKTTPKDGTVILADEQYAGRGQAGSEWVSEPLKNLTFSVIYFTDFLPASAQYYLNMAVALGLREAVQACLPGRAEVRIKWPNDIYVKNLKVAGILIENIIQGVNLAKSVIGIGLNVNQEHFPETIQATSLKLESGREADRMEVLAKVLECIERPFLELKAGERESLRKKYHDQLFRYGEWSRYSDRNGAFNGRICGVNEFGNLLVETEKGVREYGMKEVVFL